MYALSSHPFGETIQGLFTGHRKRHGPCFPTLFFFSFAVRTNQKVFVLDDSRLVYAAPILRDESIAVY